MGLFLEVLQAAGLAAGRDLERFGLMVAGTAFDHAVHDARPGPLRSLRPGVFAPWRLTRTHFQRKAARPEGLGCKWGCCLAF